LLINAYYTQLAAQVAPEGAIQPTAAPQKSDTAAPSAKKHSPKKRKTASPAGKSKAAGAKKPKTSDGGKPKASTELIVDVWNTCRQRY